MQRCSLKTAAKYQLSSLGIRDRKCTTPSSSLQLFDVLEELIWPLLGRRWKQMEGKWRFKCQISTQALVENDRSSDEAELAYSPFPLAASQPVLLAFFFRLPFSFPCLLFSRSLPQKWEVSCFQNNSKHKRHTSFHILPLSPFFPICGLSPPLVLEKVTPK